MTTNLLKGEVPARSVSSVQAIKAAQVAFDVSQAVLEAVRKAAFASSLSTSDQVRAVLGLDIVRQAKRPRLTISLNNEDYEILGQRFGLAPSDHLAIKEQVIATLVAFSQTAAAKATDQLAVKKARARGKP